MGSLKFRQLEPDEANGEIGVSYYGQSIYGDLYVEHMRDQILARHLDDLSGDPAAFERHMARIRQKADGNFEKLAPNEGWYLYLPGEWTYGAQEVDALRVRGDIVTEDNVLVRWP